MCDAFLAPPQSSLMAPIAAQRAEQRYQDHNQSVAAYADRVFAVLMGVQWIAAVITALVITPRTWFGASGGAALPVALAAGVGGMISLPVIVLAVVRPGYRLNRYVVSVSQGLTSVLLIHLTGGRIETHFHIFGSLAFLTLYRDWTALVPATAVVAIDQLVRGAFWSEPAYGAAASGGARWPESMGWVLFEDAVLMAACLRIQQEMREFAKQWAQVSVSKELMDAEVNKRITGLEASEERLWMCSLRTRKIIDTAYDAFVATTQAGLILEWSERADALFGWSAEEAIGRDIRELLGVDELFDELSEGVVKSMARKQTGQRLETFARHRDGTRMPVEASISAMCLDENDLTINVFFHDITARKEMQAQLLHAQKMQGVGQLAAGIAHEINTPTQYAGDNMQFVLDAYRDVDELLSRFDGEGHVEPPTAEEWRAWRERAAAADVTYLRAEIPQALEQALEGIHRIGQITRAMKEFSHPGVVEKKDADLHRIIENSITVCRNEWKYVAELKTEFDPRLTTLACLPGELSQVFVNLIVNAAQAIGSAPGRRSDAMGSIVVRTKRIGDWAEIAVVDDGPGIPPDIRQRVFEPFFTTKEVGKGTGQGLAIAHAVVVEKHRGTISLSSEVGRGTTFTLRLPISDSDSVTESELHHETSLVC